MKLRNLLPSTLLVVPLVLSSCSSSQQTGTLIGAGAGAAAGMIAGNNVDGLSKTEGAIAGAAVGGLLGNMQGRQNDKINALEQQVATSNQTIVNVKNSNGSVIPVSVTKTPSGWQGPRGEYYASIPTSEQLRPVYGF